MSSLSKHLGEPQPMEINGDQILIKPLTMEYMPDLMKIMKSFRGDPNNPQGAFENLGDEGLNALTKVINATLQKSFPDETDEIREQFGLKYLFPLIDKIFEINLDLENVKEDAKTKILERLKKAQEARDASQIPKVESS